MADIDTSREAVERLAAILDNPQAQPDYYGTAATLRALLDERDSLRKLDAQFGEVEAWICLHTDFAAPPHETEKGASGLIAALKRMKAERDCLRRALTGTLAAMQATIEDELTDSEISRLWNAAVGQAEAALKGGGDE